MRLCEDFELSSTAWFSTWIDIGDTSRNVKILESKRIYRLAGGKEICAATGRDVHFVEAALLSFLSPQRGNVYVKTM